MLNIRMNNFVRGVTVLNVFRDDGAVIRRLVGYQFVSAIVGAMLSTAAMNSKWLNCLTSIVSAVFYCYFIYTAVWDAAAKDRLKVDGGRLGRDMSRGLKFAFGANLPNIILGVLAFLLCAIGTFTQMEWAGNAGAIVVVISRLWQAMYNGIIVYVIPVGIEGFSFVVSNLIYLAIIIPAFVVSHIAYHMGYNNRHIFKASAKNN